MIGAKFNFLNKFILGGREHFINEYGDLDPHRQNIDTDRDIDGTSLQFHNGYT